MSKGDLSQKFKVLSIFINQVTWFMISIICISINVEKLFDKIQQPFMIKHPSKTEIDGIFLNVLKGYLRA